MIIGTSHFVSQEHAVRYYTTYEDGESYAVRKQYATAAVAQKLAEGEIHIGEPTLQPGQKLRVIDNGARYAIEEPEPTLYETLIQAGIKTSNHESDLYFPVTAETREILSRYPLEKKNAVTFFSDVDNCLCFDVPFAYTPWWEARAAKNS